jgi:hypothetical protein
MSQESSGGPGGCALALSLRSGTIRDRIESAGQRLVTDAAPGRPAQLSLGR